jgi:hypothetical protein
MDIKTITSLSNSKKKYHNMEIEPKREQMQIAASIKNGKVTLGILPTGFVLW